MDGKFGALDRLGFFFPKKECPTCEILNVLSFGDIRISFQDANNLPTFILNRNHVNQLAGNSAALHDYIFYILVAPAVLKGFFY